MGSINPEFASSPMTSWAQQKISGPFPAMAAVLNWVVKSLLRIFTSTLTSYVERVKSLKKNRNFIEF